jgi:GTP 3',8-cyclase
MIYLPSLETNITYYCQNKCVSCNHMIPLIDKPYHVDPGVIERDIYAVKEICRSDEFSIIGGEPTLHPEIVEIIRMIKRSEIAKTVLTYTNGQAMKHLPDAFYQEIDILFVDPYKIGEEEKKYISNKCAEFDLPLHWHSTNFRQQFFRNKHSKEHADGLFNSCWYRFNRSVIDEGYFYRCCTSPFIPKYLLGQAKEADAIQIKGLTEEKLRAYLNPAQAPEICYVCAGHMGDLVGWRETTRDKWLDESLG